MNSTLSENHALNNIEKGRGYEIATISRGIGSRELKYIFFNDLILHRFLPASSVTRSIDTNMVTSSVVKLTLVLVNTCHAISVQLVSTLTFALIMSRLVDTFATRAGTAHTFININTFLRLPGTRSFQHKARMTLKYFH